MLLGRGDDSNRIPWAQLVIEAVLVILSVVLALALNSWRENTVNDDLAKQAVRNIRTEVEANWERVKERIQYHKALRDSLQENPEMGVALKPAFIQNDAWETAQAMQAAAHIDFEVAAQASKIHGLQEMYRGQFVQSAMFAMYQGNEGTSTSGMVLDLLSIEQILLEQYKKLIELIES